MNSYREGYRDGYRDAREDMKVFDKNLKCPGCGVPVGTSCWDNCSLHPPFSQPKFVGPGQYEYKR